MIFGGRESVAGFRTYAAATLISEAGSAVSWIALPILVYQLTSSALWTAASSAANAVPYLTFGLFAGAIADRRARIGLMVGANLISGFALASIPVAFYLGRLTAPQIIVAAVISQSAFVFYDAANFGFLMSLVGRDGILSANGFLYAYIGLLETIAPAAVGLVLSHVSVAYLVAFDAVSFAVASVLLTQITAVPDLPERIAPDQKLIAGVAEGIRYFRHNRVVGRMTLISALMTAANGGVVSVLIVWVTETFHLATHDARIGLFYASITVSGIAAAKIAEFVGERWTPDVAMKALVPTSAAFGYATLITPAWWLAAVLLGMSMGVGLASVILAVTVRQQAIPDELQSRVNALGRMIAFGLAYSAGAVLAGGLGVTIPMEAALAVVLLTRVAATVVVVAPLHVRTEEGQPEVVLAD